MYFYICGDTSEKQCSREGVGEGGENGEGGVCSSSSGVGRGMGGGGAQKAQTHFCILSDV